MPEAVLVIWWTTLIAAVLLVVPVILYLLNRTLRSALEIQAYSAETLAAARGLAGNLDGLKDLEETPALALRVRDATAGLVADASRFGRLEGEGQG